MGSIIGWIVALVALVRFLPSVNEEVGLQITSLAKGLVALWAIKSLALWFLPSVNEGVGLQMMICCTENNCTSWLHCGSACDSKGYLCLQMSRDIGHKTFDLPSSNCFTWLSDGDWRNYSDEHICAIGVLSLSLRFAVDRYNVFVYFLLLLMLHNVPPV